MPAVRTTASLASNPNCARSYAIAARAKARAVDAIRSAHGRKQGRSADPGDGAVPGRRRLNVAASLEHHHEVRTVELGIAHFLTLAEQGAGFPGSAAIAAQETWAIPRGRQARRSIGNSSANTPRPIEQTVAASPPPHMLCARHFVRLNLIQYGNPFTLCQSR